MFDSEAITLGGLPAISLMLGALAMFLMLRGKPRTAVLAAVATVIPIGIALWLNTLEGDTREFWMTAAPLIVIGSIVVAVVSVGIGALLGDLVSDRK